MSNEQLSKPPQSLPNAPITLRGGVGKAPAADGYVASRLSHLVLEVADQEVGRFEFSASGDRFEIDDMSAFESFAEDQGKLEVVLAPDPEWTQAILKYAGVNPTTGDIFDTRSGQSVPGLRFVSGGLPTGVVRWVWSSADEELAGEGALLRAYYRGDLDALMQATQDSAAGMKSATEDA
ncbi:hypothetical protein ACFQ6U_13560 [Streptomyces sp. NPDC056465]|uniref:hypothetical protein n=1 Tax=unclassified Streptomyces TaxID=2593676 RepID=UPI0035D87661